MATIRYVPAPIPFGISPELRAYLERELHAIANRLGAQSVLVLHDGTAAPATLSGIAQVYVDSADGDLKVKFSDGVTKTIATDT